MNIISLNQIFTEYDERISLDINKDPLGFQMIWTHFGQKIFENKTTSVALDIRSYNINLFNHYVVYKLRLNNKDLDFITVISDLKDKVERIILLLENIIIWSWWQSENRQGEDNLIIWDKNGLLGTSKASSIWNKKNEIFLDLNTEIKKNENKLELLKNQKSLGVNGRYKRPFIEMEFFDTKYEYTSSSKILFEEFGKIFENDDNFNNLVEFFIKFIPTSNKKIQDINNNIDSITKLFAKTKLLTDNMNPFWMKQLGLEKSPAKEIYAELKNKYAEIKDKKMLRKNVYSNVYKNLENSAKEKQLLEDIINVEQRLSYLYWIFEDIRNHEFNGIETAKINREYFTKLNVISKVKDDSIDRLNDLNDINTINKLIEYHKKLMKSRNQNFWIDIVDDRLKIYINSKHKPDEIKNKLEYDIKDLGWENDYYLNSIRNIQNGLE